MTIRINIKVKSLLSTLLAVLLLGLPITGFAAETDAATLDDLYLDDYQEIIENSDSGVTIYNVNNGNTFAEIAANISGSNYESIVGFDVNGNKVFDHTSYIANRSYTNTKIRQDFAARYGTTVIHNHPSGGSFSAGDLYAEAKFQTPRIIVLSKQYVYVLEPTTTGWGDPTAMQNYYQQRYDLYYAEYVRTRTGGAEIAHRTMQDVAAAFNMLYYRCPTDQFDFDDTSLFYSEAVARRQYQDYYGYSW